MKVSITYSKTGFIETRECSEITFDGGRLVMESKDRFSAFYPTDGVRITIIESEKIQPGHENSIENKLAELSQEEKLNEVYMHREFMPVTY